MKDEEFLASIRERITTYRSRKGKQAPIMHLLTIDEVARMVRLRDHGWAIKSVARAVGLAPSTVFKFCRGRNTANKPWPELVEALSRTADTVKAKSIRPSREALRERAHRAANTRRKGAVKVVAWRDITGVMHDTEAKAIAASRRAVVVSRIEGLIHIHENLRAAIIENLDAIESVFK